MSDDDDRDDVESIREKKAEALKKQLDSPDEPVHVEDAAHLSELIEGHSPLLVDFHADWCGPCKMLAPTIESLAGSTPATMAKVDVDEHQELAVEHGAQSIPTLLLFVDGELVERTVGAKDEGTLRSLIESHA